MEAPEDIPSIRSLRPQRHDARGEPTPQQLPHSTHHNGKWQEKTLPLPSPRQASPLFTRGCWYCWFTRFSWLWLLIPAHPGTPVGTQGFCLGYAGRCGFPRWFNWSGFFGWRLRLGFLVLAQAAGLALQPAKPVAGSGVSIAVPVPPPGPRRDSNRAGLSSLTHRGWLLFF